MTGEELFKRNPISMKYIEYQKITLKDGRTATIVEVLEPDREFIVDVDLFGPDWETIEISIDMIRQENAKG